MRKSIALRDSAVGVVAAFFDQIAFGLFFAGDFEREVGAEPEAIMAV
jgi:hypothetical protein